MKTGVLFIVLAASALLARAGTIPQYTAGTESGFGAAWGESFLTPAGSPCEDITFNFYSDVPAVTPAASGDAFLLTQEYLGTPSALSSLTPGFLAESVSNAGGVYAFDPGVVINPGTEYWVYENVLMSLTGSTSGGSAPEHLYAAISLTGGFSSVSSQITNFNLSGTVVPEPGSLYLSIWVFIFALIPICTSHKKFYSLKRWRSQLGRKL
jgi:hypothetical protein